MLSRRLKERRKGLMTQAELATKISSSQPRIAMAENGDSSVVEKVFPNAVVVIDRFHVNEVYQRQILAFPPILPNRYPIAIP